VLLKDNSEYARKIELFNRLIKDIPEKTTEFILVSNDNIRGKKKLTNVLDKLKCYLRIVPFTMFIMDIPSHCSVPKHEIMNADDAKKFLEEQRIMKKYTQAISDIDPPIVWLGAKIGQFVKITRHSNSAIEAVAIRLVGSVVPAMSEEDEVNLGTTDQIISDTSSSLA
jgi:DNA-directed RNA polymerase subunit H (RpoH/RPB5)